MIDPDEQLNAFCYINNIPARRHGDVIMFNVNDLEYNNEDHDIQYIYEPPTFMDRLLRRRRIREISLDGRVIEYLDPSTSHKHLLNMNFLIKNHVHGIVLGNIILPHDYEIYNNINRMIIRS